jgi:ATP-dependent Zn protease
VLKGRSLRVLAPSDQVLTGPNGIPNPNNSQGGGLMQIGKSKAKIYVEADTGVRFEDVAGVDEAKDELREIVDGMSEKLGHIALEKDERSFPSPNPLGRGARERSYPDETAAAVDDGVRATE